MQMGIMANVKIMQLAIDAAAPGNERSAVDGPVPQNGAKGSKEIIHV